MRKIPITIDENQVAEFCRRDHIAHLGAPQALGRARRSRNRGGD
jgi:hypothetical protein